MNTLGGDSSAADFVHQYDHWRETLDITTIRGNGVLTIAVASPSAYRLRADELPDFARRELSGFDGLATAIVVNPRDVRVCDRSGAERVIFKVDDGLPARHTGITPGSYRQATAQLLHQLTGFSTGRLLAALEEASELPLTIERQPLAPWEQATFRRTIPPGFR